MKQFLITGNQSMYQSTRDEPRAYQHQLTKRLNHELTQCHNRHWVLFATI